MKIITPLALHELDYENRYSIGLHDIVMLQDGRLAEVVKCYENATKLGIEIIKEEKKTA